MLIITADDLGRDLIATDSCLSCFRKGLITSSSIMVLMRDSERAADAALSSGLETGLHVNLTVPYTAGPSASAPLERLLPVVSYLHRGKWAQVVYNPRIRNDVEYSFGTQLEEYRRLFQREPAHINGHEHMHLCMNMILGRVIPSGSAVRRNFSFAPGEKNISNRTYRQWVDSRLLKSRLSTDFFFSVDPVQDGTRVRRIFELAKGSSVELMVHPWREDQFAFMTGQLYADLISRTSLGTFGALPRVMKR